MVNLGGFFSGSCLTQVQAATPFTGTVGYFAGYSKRFGFLYYTFSRFAYLIHNFFKGTWPEMLYGRVVITQLAKLVYQTDHLVGVDMAHRLWNLSIPASKALAG
jgi:hypothetical protein